MLDIIKWSQDLGTHMRREDPLPRKYTRTHTLMELHNLDGRELRHKHSRTPNRHSHSGEMCVYQINSFGSNDMAYLLDLDHIRPMQLVHFKLFIAHLIPGQTYKF